MKLSLQQLRQITCGAVSVQQEGEWVSFHRFTSRQEQLYLQRSQSLYERALCTAGISLEMDTDSRQLQLAFRLLPGCSFQRYVISVFADGKRLGELSGYIPEDRPWVDAQKNFSLDDGVKRIRIVLPWNIRTMLRALQLEDGAQFQPVAHQGRLLVYGDSITQGYTMWLPENGHISRLCQKLGLESVNRAMGGEAFHPPLAELSEPMTLRGILVAYGANDWHFRTLEQTRENAFRFCSALRGRYPGVPMLVLSPIYNVHQAENERKLWPFEELMQLLRDLSEKLDDVYFIDATGCVPAELSCFAEDQVHPNDVGAQLYARNLYEKLPEHFGNEVKA